MAPAENPAVNTRHRRKKYLLMVMVGLIHHAVPFCRPLLLEWLQTIKPYIKQSATTADRLHSEIQ
jgi:hypothetical protein